MHIPGLEWLISARKIFQGLKEYEELFSSSNFVTASWKKMLEYKNQTSSMEIANNVWLDIFPIAVFPIFF